MKRFFYTDLTKPKLNPANFFLVFFCLHVFLNFILLFFTKGSYLSEIVWNARFAPDGFDFFSPITRSLRPYDNQVFYPPFCMFLYWILGHIIPVVIKDSDVTNWWRLFADITMHCCMCIIAFFTYKSLRRKSSLYILSFLLCFICSHAFGFAELHSHNSCIWALCFLVPALYLKDSDNPRYREVALVFIAIAANIKLTPAVFGLIYLKEKRFKEAFRLVIYGLVLFLVPMFLFGGFKILKTIFQVTNDFSFSFTQPRPETINGVCLFISDYLGLGVSGNLIGKIATILYFLTVILLICLTKFDYKSMTLLCSFNVILVNHSYPYTLIYFLPAMILFIKEVSVKFNLLDYLYGALFVLVFASYPFLKINWPTATFITNYFWLYIFVFLLAIEKIMNVANVEKTKKSR